MTKPLLTKEMPGLENALMERPLDFSGTYMTVCDLHAAVKANPDNIGKSTIQALRQVLKSKKHVSQKKSLFLYRQAAECLVNIPANSSKKDLSHHALSTLREIVQTSEQNPHRAAAEALGTLPIRIEGPRILGKKIPRVISLAWEDIVTHCKIPANSSIRKFGRSLVVDVKDKNRILVIKMSSQKKDICSLHTETAWMEYLFRQQKRYSVKFHIPIPVKIKGRSVFRLSHLPHDFLCKSRFTRKAYGIVFFADPNYFKYPNEHGKFSETPSTVFKKVISQNAWLLGNLTASGIIHTAPIPLFHNRIQRHRRSDRGLYEWPMGGRLDRWLASSRYPNLGFTGIRDFEHFVSFTNTGRGLYEHIGTHLLSLILISGSYFRNKRLDLVGLDRKGRPTDARHLFNPSLFKKFILCTFFSYYKGFTGRKFHGPLPFNAESLTENLIKEMGVDRYMEEILRAADIKNMTDETLCIYLRKRGYQKEEISCIKKNGRDVITSTGPHLGGFNQRVSPQELVSFLETVSAVCILGKFLEKG